MGVALKKGASRDNVGRKTQWDRPYLVTKGKIKSQRLLYLLAFGTKHVAELSLKPPKD